MRYLINDILKDLKKKMVFLGGPRQVGKTTLAKWIMNNHYKNGRYFNWDFSEDRDAILNYKWDSHCDLLVFDEIHKYPNWKNWLKGLYDTHKDKHSFLITGSARMDIYKRGGDSMLGRYHYWRLHPFTIDENINNYIDNNIVDRLLTHGGFPEPFCEGDLRESRRWRRERFDHIIREDVRDLEMIHNIQTLALFVENLKRRVSSNLVVSNIARDLEISPKTAKSWLVLAENMYLVFSVYPFSTKASPRAITKPPKVYFYDNGDVKGDDGAIFENLVATHLIKKLNYLEDRDGYRYELKYLRDKDGREVDFVITRDSEIQELIEVKLSDTKLTRGLKYYKEKLAPPKTTVILYNINEPYEKDGVTYVSAQDYFKKQ